MTDRKKPGVAFWATVVLVALVAYVASFGPAVWLVARRHLDKKTAERAYWPILCAFPYFPRIRWYGEFGMPKGEHLMLEVTPPDGIGYSTPFDGR
jgi:uncharacterized membrane protein YhaH (DUF805 family)